MEVQNNKVLFSWRNWFKFDFSIFNSAQAICNSNNSVRAHVYTFLYMKINIEFNWQSNVETGYGQKSTLVSFRRRAAPFVSIEE